MDIYVEATAKFPNQILIDLPGSTDGRPRRRAHHSALLHQPRNSPEDMKEYCLGINLRVVCSSWEAAEGAKREQPSRQGLLSRDPSKLLADLGRRGREAKGRRKKKKINPSLPAWGQNQIPRLQYQNRKKEEREALSLSAALLLLLFFSLSCFFFLLLPSEIMNKQNKQIGRAHV